MPLGTAGGTGDAAGSAGRDDGGPKRDRPEDRSAALSGKPLVPGDRPAVRHQGGQKSHDKAERSNFL